MPTTTAFDEISSKCLFIFQGMGVIEEGQRIHEQKGVDYRNVPPNPDWKLIFKS